MSWNDLAPHTEGLRGRRVLIVEDEPLIALDLDALLSAEGAVVVGPCGDLDEGLRQAEGAKLSAALLDVRIGGATAAPIAKALAARGVPFAFYTGQADTDAIRLAWPGAPVIAKPMPARDLLRAMEALCGREATAAPVDGGANGSSARPRRAPRQPEVSQRKGRRGR